MVFYNLKSRFFPPPNNIPKYFSISFDSGTPNKLETFILSFIRLFDLKKIVDLSKLIHCLEHTSYSYRICFSVWALSSVASPNKMQSSMNKRCAICGPLLLTLAPHNTLSFTTNRINIDKPSMQIRKMNGLKGFPCLRPLPRSNTSQILPFTITEYEFEVMHRIIRFTQSLSKPNRCHLFSYNVPVLFKEDGWKAIFARSFCKIHSYNVQVRHSGRKRQQWWRLAKLEFWWKFLKTIDFFQSFWK